MKFKIKPYNRNINTEDLISDIKAVAQKLKKETLTKAEYLENGKYSLKPYEQRFKKWNEVLLAANLKVENFKNIPEESLFKNIEEVWIKLGRQPKFKELRKPISKFSVSTYVNRYGSFYGALEKFVEFINSEPNDALDEPTTNDENKQKIDSNKTIKHKTSRDISERLRFRVLMRDGFTCKKCGRSPVKEMGVELHVDHVVPWSKGGETVLENLETKCKECNLGKGNAFMV